MSKANIKAVANSKATKVSNNKNDLLAVAFSLVSEDKEIKAKSNETRVSVYFKKVDSEDYHFDNLNSTCKFLENNNVEFMNKILTMNNNQKMTLNQFHKLLSTLLKSI